METIGYNTEKSRDLQERAAAIAGKVSLLGQIKREAKRVKDELAGLYKLAGSAGYDKDILEGRVRELLMGSEQLEMHLETERDQGQVIESYRHALGLLGEDDDAESRDARWRQAIVKTMNKSGYAQDLEGHWHRMKAPADGEPTISVNGGPAHPMSVVREAVEIAKRHKGRIRGQSVDLPEPVEA